MDKKSREGMAGCMLGMMDLRRKEGCKQRKEDKQDMRDSKQDTVGSQGKKDSWQGNWGIQAYGKVYLADQADKADREVEWVA